MSQAGPGIADLPATGSPSAGTGRWSLRRWWNVAGGLPAYRPRAGSGRMVVQAWIASRGLIALVALLLAVFDGRDLLAMTNNWDAAHFAAVAEHGYDPHGTEMAFFPGLPLLLRAGLLVGLPTQISGVILALIGSALAAAALLRLGGPWAAVIWLFAPTAVFTAVGYTEAPFCAFAFWAWERARSDRWLAAALLAAGACTFRVSGLFLIGSLVVMIIASRRVGWRLRLRRTATLIIPVAVLAAYMIYLHALGGSWTAWYDAQVTGWYRGFTWPWQSFINTWHAVQPGAYADRPYWAWVFRGEMLAMFVGAGVTIWCLVRKLWAEAAWVGVQVLAFSLSYWFMSVNRAVLLWFPLMILLAHWAGHRPRSRPRRILHRSAVAVGSAVGVAVMVTWSWLYFAGYWAS